MEQSPSWEANRFSASQEIPRILWNPKVQYRIHKRPPPIRILSHLDPVHTPTSHFPKIHLNIFIPSTPGSLKRSLSLRFSHQNLEYSSPPYALHAPPISFFSITHSNNRECRGLLCADNQSCILTNALNWTMPLVCINFSGFFVTELRFCISFCATDRFESRLKPTDPFSEKSI